MDSGATAHYRAPGWVTRRVLNAAVAGATRLGLSVRGSRVLVVRGRKTGQPQSTPVNLLHHDGRDYLVAPRGETQWVRNVRAAGGELDLVLGRRRTHHVATEVVGEDKVPVLRAYLAHWGAETGAFFEGVGAGASDEEIAAVAPKHPVFALGAGH